MSEVDMDKRADGKLQSCRGKGSYVLPHAPLIITDRRVKGDDGRLSSSAQALKQDILFLLFLDQLCALFQALSIIIH